MHGREKLEAIMISANGDSGYMYEKDEADSVMDAMEARIKELESIPHTDNTAVIDNLEARIKELENKLYGSSGQSTRLLNRINNFSSTDPKATDLIDDCYKCIHQQMETISKMETTQKWISVEDVLPQWGKLVKIKFKDGKEDERRFSADYKWVSKGMQTCESVNVTHWQPLPPPPTTEENK